MNGKTPISALQELMAARGHALPRYQEEGFGTDFKCTVFVEGITAVGRGSSKKTAKHQSAENALKVLQSPEKQPIQVEEIETVEQPQKNYVGELNEYSSKNGFGYPNYEFVTALVDGKFVFKCLFVGKEVTGIGMNKKDAKQISAKNMLQLVRNGSNNNNYLKYKQSSENYIVPETDDHIIKLFEELSIKKEEPQCQSNNTSPKKTDLSLIRIKVEEEHAKILENPKTVEALQQKLKDLNVEYTTEIFKKNPYVVFLVIKNTNNTFCGVGDTKEQALVDVYTGVLRDTHSGILNADLTALA